MSKKIIFSGGGTGGHIFPAINLMKHFFDKGYKVLMSKSDEKNAKRIGHTVTTTVSYALRKTNQERDVRYWTYHEDENNYAIVFVSSKVLEQLDFSW